MKNIKLFCSVPVTLTTSVLIIFLIVNGCTKKDDSKPVIPKPVIPKSIQVIIDDMTLAGDACGHGTEAMDWGCGGINPHYAGATVPNKNNKGNWWQAMTNWGQVYIKRGASQASTNTRVQIRNLTTKFLNSHDSIWQTVQSGTFGGAAYVEDFKDNSNKGADIRDESGNQGGLSMIVGEGNYAGYNYHFYTNGRAQVDVNTIIGVFTTAEMRLIKADTNGTDDRDQSKYIAGIGADWWLNTSTGWLPDWSANSGIGGGRWKYITNEWQSFNFTSQTQAQTLANPPIAATAL